MCNISNFCVQPLQICNVLLLFYQYCNSAASIAMMQAKNIIMKKSIYSWFVEKWSCSRVLSEWPERKQDNPFQGMCLRIK